MGFCYGGALSFLGVIAGPNCLEDRGNDTSAIQSGCLIHVGLA
jgi:hypothetical protein